MEPIRIAIVGVGKIARDQHMPAIEGSPAFSLAATVSPHHPGKDGIPHVKSLEQLLESGPAIDAVALCTPPQVRYDLAVQALQRGVHVFLEKPPGATLSEVVALRDRADKVGITLFASWHSRFAAGVAPARAWLSERKVEKVSIVWREDVRVWHPGQDWIWEPGGLGVFDPGINALSILTHILPRPVFMKSAVLSIPGKPRRTHRGGHSFQRHRRRAHPHGPRLAADRPAKLGHCGRDRRRHAETVAGRRGADAALGHRA